MNAPAKMAKCDRLPAQDGGYLHRISFAVEALYDLSVTIPRALEDLKLAHASGDPGLLARAVYTAHREIKQASSLVDPLITNTEDEPAIAGLLQKLRLAEIRRAPEAG